MSRSARRSSRCIPSGGTSPACSASVQPFFRSKPATSPDTYSRSRTRGSDPANLPAIRSARACGEVGCPHGERPHPIRRSTSDVQVGPGHGPVREDPMCVRGSCSQHLPLIAQS